MREIVGPLFFVNLHQTRKSSYPGDGREHSLIQGTLYRLLDANLTLINLDEQTMEREGSEMVEERLLNDGVDKTDHLPLIYLSRLIKELPSQCESDPLDNLLPPTINTLVGLRGLMLHRKLLDSIILAARPDGGEAADSDLIEDELPDYAQDENAQVGVHI